MLVGALKYFPVLSSTAVHPLVHTQLHWYPTQRQEQKFQILGWEDAVPLLAVESALGTSGAALVARIARDTHVCG